MKIENAIKKLEVAGFKITQTAKSEFAYGDVFHAEKDKLTKYIFFNTSPLKNENHAVVVDDIWVLPATPGTINMKHRPNLKVKNFAEAIKYANAA